MTSDCVRGCVIRGVHFAECEDYGREDGACQGCAPRSALDGAVVCASCHGRLQRAFEAAPELLEHLRERSQNVSAYRLSFTRSAGTPAEKAPTDPDLLDALRDLGVVLRGEGFSAADSPEQTREAAAASVSQVLARFDDLASDAQSVSEWWPLMVGHSLDNAPAFWTFGRAGARWPIRDRRRWAAAACPDCDLMTVTVCPPARDSGRTWYVCLNCEWDAHDGADDGLWGMVFASTVAPVTAEAVSHG